MALNLKNRAVEELAAEVAAMTGESKTEAIRKALEERRQRLSFQVVRRNRAAAMERFLREEVWPLVPPEQLGRGVSRQEREEILGYGKDGV